MSQIEPPIPQIAKALKYERNRLGLSIAEVARQAKIAKSTLSQLEAGIGNPSIETLWSICLVLNIQVSHLLEPPIQTPKVIRHGEGTTLASKNNNYRATLLAACPPNTCRDIYQIEVEPGQVHVSEPHHQGVVEHVIITKGKARLGLASENYELDEGDYISYSGALPHIFEALQGRTSAILVSEYR